MEARLAELLRSTVDELEEIWRSIGFSKCEREDQIEVLFHETKELYKNKIESEKLLYERYKNEVDLGCNRLICPWTILPLIRFRFPRFLCR